MTTFQTNSQNQLYWVADNIIASDFPPPESALRDPDGLLAIGGDLTPARILHAYKQGIFPWYNAGQPIMWWTPDPRCILELNELRISRSLRKTLRKRPFRVMLNSNFDSVIHACAAPRDQSADTWITDELRAAFVQLHHAGHAHSVECYADDELVGGLYGIAIGRVFFGESMFSRRSDASKVALVYLCHYLAQLEFRLIDCQIYSGHLRSLGAKPIARPLFSNLLEHYCDLPIPANWPSTELNYE